MASAGASRPEADREPDAEREDNRGEQPAHEEREHGQDAVDLAGEERPEADDRDRGHHAHAHSRPQDQRAGQQLAQAAAACVAVHAVERDHRHPRGR
jgi:hypothetical protein